MLLDFLAPFEISHTVVYFLMPSFLYSKTSLYSKRFVAGVEQQFTTHITQLVHYSYTQFAES